MRVNVNVCVYALAAGLFLSVFSCPCTAEESGSTRESGSTSAVADSTAPRTHRNALLALGERQLDAGEINEAIATFAGLSDSYPDDAYVFTRLGAAHLKKKAFKEAEAAFKEAKRIDKTLPDAYVGLGLVYVESPARGMNSYYNFRKAVGEASRATKIDPNYGPAYRLLGEAYERFQEDHERAVGYYMKYIELEPDDPEGLYYFGIACVQAEGFQKIDKYIAPYLKTPSQGDTACRACRAGAFLPGTLRAGAGALRATPAESGWARETALRGDLACGLRARAQGL